MLLLLTNNSFPLKLHKSKPFPFAPLIKKTLLWPRSKYGIYSVKTSYQLLYGVDRSEVASSSDYTEVNKFWSWLWKLKVLSKVKIFLSRAAQTLCYLKLIYRRGKLWVTLFTPITCKIEKPSSMPNGIAMKFSNHYLQLGACMRSNNPGLYARF